MGVHWKGAEVVEKVKAAAVAGADETLEAAAEQARGHHGWKSQTGTAEASIKAQPAELHGNEVRGQFGSYGADAWYFVFLETGTSTITADDTLRRAADREFPQLADRIKANL